MPTSELHRTDRRSFLKTVGMGSAAFALGQTLAAAAKKKPNVLFLAVDDLRPELGCYGNERTLSPNIDALAKNGILFDRAYCQQPICMASRASLLSGYRPDHANIYNCGSLKDLDPDALTINKQFEANGYSIWSTGKIYHHHEDYEAQFGDRYKQAEGSWEGRGYLGKESIAAMRNYAKSYKRGDSSGRGPAFESPDVADNAYGDGIRTDMAIEQLKRFSGDDKPFFMAVGYAKPHLPFNAPEKYWKLYEPGDIQLADNPFLPKNATAFTPYHFGELRNYYGIPKDEALLPEELSRNLVHGYYACVSYVDAQIGRLMDALDKLGLRDNTVIVLWGDHGWKLGEHGMWCKHTPFELDAHVPLIFSYPGMKHRGAAATSFAEFVDIYPTLCELCGLEIPAHTEGDSLVGAMANPGSTVKKVAFTQWPKKDRTNPDKVIMSYSIKTEQYRYIEWTHKKSGKVLATELYDHAKDPDENVNIASEAEQKETVERLSRLLDGGRGWKKFRLRPHDVRG